MEKVRDNARGWRAPLGIALSRVATGDCLAEAGCGSEHRDGFGHKNAPMDLSLTDAAVHPFPKQVGVAAVAGVLLNHVDQHRAQRWAAAVRLQALNA